MKIYEVFACKRCWACLWFICFSRNHFDLFSKGSQWANLQWTAQVSRLAGAHKAPGTLRTSGPHNRRSHRVCRRDSAWHFRRSVRLVSEGHQLIALVRSWSVDVSWLWNSVVSHWCLSRWEAMAAASCHCDAKMLHVSPKVGRTQNLWWYISDLAAERDLKEIFDAAIQFWTCHICLNITRCWRNQLAPAESTDAQWTKSKPESLELGIVWAMLGHTSRYRWYRSHHGKRCAMACQWGGTRQWMTAGCGNSVQALEIAWMNQRSQNLGLLAMFSLCCLDRCNSLDEFCSTWVMEGKGCFITVSEL